MLCLCCCTINICDLSFCACKPFCINVTGMQNDAQATHHKNTTDPLNDAAACNLQETLDATNRMTKSWCPGKVWMPSKLPILPASQACLRSSRLAVPQLSSMSIWGSQARGPAPAHPGACLGWPWGPPAGQPGKRAGMGRHGRHAKQASCTGCLQTRPAWTMLACRHPSHHPRFAQANGWRCLVTLGLLA